MLKNNKITQIGHHGINCLSITTTLDGRPAVIMQWAKRMLIISALIGCPGNPAWAASGGFFISASLMEISSTILLTGLSLAALIFGLRLVLQSVMVRPTR